MGKFARRDTIDSMNLFYDVMLCDRKIQCETEKEDVEASYFAMCLLLPEEPFMDAVNSLGGINECYNIDKLKVITKMFNVEEKLVRVRLKDISARIDETEAIKRNDEINSVDIMYRDSKQEKLNIEPNNIAPQKKKSFFSRFKK